MKCHAAWTKWPYSVKVDAPSLLFAHRFVHLFPIKYTHAFYYMQGLILRWLALESQHLLEKLCETSTLNIIDPRLITCNLHWNHTLKIRTIHTLNTHKSNRLPIWMIRPVQGTAFKFSPSFFLCLFVSFFISLFLCFSAPTDNGFSSRSGRFVKVPDQMSGTLLLTFLFGPVMF